MDNFSTKYDYSRACGLVFSRKLHGHTYPLPGAIERVVELAKGDILITVKCSKDALKAARTKKKTKTKTKELIVNL